MITPAARAQTGVEDLAARAGCAEGADRVRFIFIVTRKLPQAPGRRVGADGRRVQRRAGKTVFQSSFMLMTVQPCFLACSISESLKVPMLDFGP